MESRRVQRVGVSTLAVTLPSSWAKEVSLKRGDLIFFKRERDGSLKITPSSFIKRERELPEYTVDLDLCEKPETLEKVVVANYVLGRDIIRIVSSKRITGDYVCKIRHVTRKLIGMCIAEEEPNEVVLRCLVGLTNFSIPTIMQRMYRLASVMYKEAVEAVANFDQKLAKEIIQREEEADMMFLLISRLLIISERDRTVAKEIGVSETASLSNLRVIAQLLERIADFGESIARNAIHLKGYENQFDESIIENMSEMGRQSYDLAERAAKSLFDGDVRLADAVIDEYKLVIEGEEEKLERELIERSLDPDLMVYLRNVIWEVRRVAELSARIAEIAIYETLGRQSELCKMGNPLHDPKER